MQGQNHIHDTKDMASYEHSGNHTHRSTVYIQPVHDSWLVSPEHSLPVRYNHFGGATSALGCSRELRGKRQMVVALCICTQDAP
jgi:hypothetical protein